MALYEFVCGKCGDITVGSYSISSDVKKITCSKCGGKAERIISASNFIVKGYSYSNGYSKKE